MSDHLDVDRLLTEGSPGFARRTVTLEPGVVVRYDEAAWLDAIIFVTAGEIDLECSNGTCHRFTRRDILWLAPLPLRAVRNTGLVPARLLAISRCGANHHR